MDEGKEREDEEPAPDPLPPPPSGHGLLAAAAAAAMAAAAAAASCCCCWNAASHERFPGGAENRAAPGILGNTFSGLLCRLNWLCCRFNRNRGCAGLVSGFGWATVAALLTEDAPAAPPMLVK